MVVTFTASSRVANDWPMKGVNTVSARAGAAAQTAAIASATTMHRAPCFRLGSPMSAPPRRWRTFATRIGAS